MINVVVPRAVRRASTIEPGVAVLVAGLTLALVMQGAFYPRAQLVVAAVLGAGVLLVSRVAPVTRADLPVLVSVSALGGWALLDGALTGRLAGGVTYVLLLGGCLVLAHTCRQLVGQAGHHLVVGVLGGTCLVATLGWFGLVSHHPTLGFAGGGLWRASATLTYPNATACVLAMAALVGIAQRTRGRYPGWSGAVVAVLITGMAATLSRAGLLAFCVGLVVLVSGIGLRAVARAAAGPLLGALVGTLGLVPSMIAAQPGPLTVTAAVAGALAGVALGSRSPSAAWLLVVPVVGVAATVLTPRGLSSPDRLGSYEAAWQVVGEHALLGAGPALPGFTLDQPGGGLAAYRYVHNEYLQVLAELGVVGAALLLCLLLAVAVLLRGSGPTPLATGVLAACAAMAVHAGFDFLWHVPAIALLASALVGVATSGRETKGNP